MFVAVPIKEGIHSYLFTHRNVSGIFLRSKHSCLYYVYVVFNKLKEIAQQRLWPFFVLTCDRYVHLALHMGAAPRPKTMAVGIKV